MPSQEAQRNQILKQIDLNPRKYYGSGTISEVEYAAAPPPINSQAQPAGNCLIWLGLLNEGGYGIRTFTQGRDLAHREAFRESRGSEPTDSVLHLCNRPYCIQPSHLYDGTNQNNSDDRRLLTSEAIELQLSHGKHKVIEAAAKYRWPDPSETQSSMNGLPEAEDVHECNFIIPAGDLKLCQTCNKVEPSSWTFGDEPTIPPGQLQKPGNDKDSVDVQKTKTMVTELAPGLAVVATGTTDINLATSRAEHRRRRREENKRDMRPRLLSAECIDLKTNEAHKFIDSRERLVGPGLFVVVATPIKKATAPKEQSREERVAMQLLQESTSKKEAKPAKSDDK